jgi:ribosomal protein L28
LLRGHQGLYDGLKVRAGDNVSKSKHRTKRTWKPNVQKTKLWSEVLGQTLQLRVTSAALKTIDRVRAPHSLLNKTEKKSTLIEGKKKRAPFFFFFGFSRRDCRWAGWTDTCYR